LRVENLQLRRCSPRPSSDSSSLNQLTALTLLDGGPFTASSMIGAGVDFDRRIVSKREKRVDLVVLVETKERAQSKDSPRVRGGGDEDDDGRVWLE
jgi:hypothetical protein